MIQGVLGVIIWTERPHAMFVFYRDILGLDPHSIRPEFVSFKWGDVKLGIGKHSKVNGKTKEPYRIMINLGVDDIQHEYNSLRTKGVTFLRPPELESWGGWVGTFSDPDGNAVIDDYTNSTPTCIDLPQTAPVQLGLSLNATGLLDVTYTTSEDIQAFQFEVPASFPGITITGASGGDAASAGFTLQVGSNQSFSTVVGFFSFISPFTSRLAFVSTFFRRTGVPKLISSNSGVILEANIVIGIS